MKITVFGGTGFIGSAIVDELLKQGHQLRLFARPGVGPHRILGPHEEVEWITGDILSSHDVSYAIEGVDAVMHLVSTTLPKNSNDDPIYDVQSNLVGSLQILNAMVALNVPRIIFISSGGTVYGKPSYLPIDEEHPTNPQASYGVTKLAIEKYLLLYERLHGIKPLILRVANPYGERQRIETAQGAVGVFLQLALRGQPIEIWGDGGVTRDFLYVGDVADAFARALTYEGDERVFNISSGVGTSLNDLLDVIERVLGRPVQRVYKQARAFDVPVSILSNDLARSEFGWVPLMNLSDGVALTFEWARKAYM